MAVLAAVIIQITLLFARLRGRNPEVLRDRWTEQDVVRALRESDEYRRKRR